MKNAQSLVRGCLVSLLSGVALAGNMAIPCVAADSQVNSGAHAEGQSAQVVSPASQVSAQPASTSTNSTLAVSQPAATNSAAATDSASASGNTAKSLEGGVQTIDVSKKALAASISALRDMGHPLDRLQHSLEDVIKETQRKHVVLNDGPWIGDGVDGTIVPTLAEPINTSDGILPPRKQYLDLYKNDIRTLLGLIQNDADNVVIPTSAGTKAAVEWQAVSPTLKNVRDLYSLLDELTQGPVYQNTLIAKQAIRMRDDVQGVNDIRKRVYKMLN